MSRRTQEPHVLSSNIYIYHRPSPVLDDFFPIYQYQNTSMPSTSSYPAPAVSIPPSSSSSRDLLITQTSMASPTSPSSPSDPGAASRSFFGAITNRVRGRSRSRSPQPPSRTQMSPPDSAAKLQQPKKRSPHRPENDRTSSQSTTATTDSRSSIGGSDRSQWQTMSYGRHSSEVSKPFDQYFEYHFLTSTVAF